MIQTARQTFAIQRVREIQTCAGGTRVVFQDGLSSCLQEGHPEYVLLLQFANSSLRHGTAVGILLSEAGELIELNHAYRSTVRFAQQDEEDSSRLVVGFWAYSPICYLTQDHPEFVRIHRTLLDAIKTGSQVWL